MDIDIQRIRRTWLTEPTDERARLIYERAVDRVFQTPEARFQADLKPGDEDGVGGGRLWLALHWEMEFCRVSVDCRTQGGMVIARSTYGNFNHIRIWYPSREEVILDLQPGDIRISVSSVMDLTDIIDSLQDNFPAATVVSQQVAEAQSDGWFDKSGDWFLSTTARPKRREDIDHRVLQEQAMVGSTRAGLANLSPWV